MGQDEPMDLTDAASRHVSAIKWWRDPVHRNRLQLLVDLAEATAHEVRNPLTTLRGFLQLQQALGPNRNTGRPGDASHQAPPSRESPLDSKRYSALMIAEIDRVDRLIHEYIELAHDPSRRTPSELSPERSVADILPLATAHARVRDVAIEIAGHSDSRFSANESLVKQLLLNVLHRAVDAAPPGGRVTVGFPSSETAVDISVPLAGEASVHSPDECLGPISDACGARVSLTVAPGLGTGAGVLRFHVEFAVAPTQPQDHERAT